MIPNESLSPSDALARQRGSVQPFPWHTALVDRLWQHGSQSLSDAELLALLIRHGDGPRSAIDVAHTLLHQTGGDLLHLAAKKPHDLIEFPGMGRGKAAIVEAAMELGRRRLRMAPAIRPLVTSSATAHELLSPVLADAQYEEFWLLLLDRGNRLIDRVRISIGGLHGTVADPKVIFNSALQRRASGILLAHNHPSGQMRPSEEDIRLTNKLVEGARYLDIVVHDHLIITQSGYYSFSDQGQLR